MTLSESLYFEKTRKNLKSNLVLGVVLVLKYKDLTLRKMYKVIPAPSYTRLLRPPHQFGYFEFLFFFLHESAEESALHPHETNKSADRNRIFFKLFLRRYVRFEIVQTAKTAKQTPKLLFQLHTF